MSNELILVVDDEPDILGLCHRILTGEGYTVYTANSGSQAIKIAKETPLDVVLLDINMPGGNGITIFERIKHYQREVAGIVITGYPSMEAAIEALKQGISGFILKPFTPNELRQAVADAVERRHLEHDYARLQALVPLYDLSRSLMTTIEIDALLDQVVEMAVQETAADRASLMLERDDVLYIEAARGLSEEIVQRTATPVGEGIAGWVAQHGEPLLLNTGISMPPELADALTREEIGSAVCVPLALQDRIIGVLNLTKLEPTQRPFTPSDRDLITVLAGQVTIAIENARLFRRQRALTNELAQVNANLQGLQQAATAITSRLSPERVLQTILDGCVAVIENATIALGLLDVEAGTIQVHLHHGQTQARESRTLRLQPQELQTVDIHSKAMDVVEGRLSALLTELTAPTAVGVIPLAAQDQLLGAMAVGTQHELSEADVVTLTPFADQAAVAIANARLFTQLRQAYAELHQLDRLKNKFLDIAARGMHSPLSAVKTSTQLLNDSAPQDLHPELSKLRDAASELENHIDTLVKLSQLEVGKPAPRKKPVAVEEIITSVVERFRPLNEAKKQNLTVELAPDLPTIQADRAKVELIAINLVLNAIDVTPAEGEMGIEAKTVGRKLHIAVWNTGPVLSPEEQLQISEREALATDSTMHDLNGSSLGLSMACRLAEEQGGSLELSSTPGEGNTVTVILPLPEEF